MGLGGWGSLCEVVCGLAGAALADVTCRSGFWGLCGGRGSAERIVDFFKGGGFWWLTGEAEMRERWVEGSVPCKTAVYRAECAQEAAPEGEHGAG